MGTHNGIVSLRRASSSMRARVGSLGWSAEWMTGMIGCHECRHFVPFTFVWFSLPIHIIFRKYRYI
jgi:hypothetical protein